jgi:hypothetical protein
VIEQIKGLGEDITHVSLNLIKCNFDAKEKDVERAFPEYKFIKVKNYNPGSFEVIFELRIDAINFVRNCFDRRILNRRFFIKMGRQHKEVLEDWTCVGQVPRRFNQPRNSNKGKREDQPPRKQENGEGEGKEKREKKWESKEQEGKEEGEGKLEGKEEEEKNPLNIKTE